MTIRTMAIAAAVLAATAGAALAQDATAVPAPPPPGEWRTIASENLLVIDTNKGRVLVELAPEIAPAHVERIKLLASRGFFDNLVWHRVIDWFMAQTGDPLGTGEGQSWYPDLKAEFTFRRGADMAFTPVAAPVGALVGFVDSIPVQTQPDALMSGTSDKKVHGWALYCPGVAGMARDEGNDTANSQFFLMRQAYPALDKRYTVWGRVVSGLDVVRSLKASDMPDGLVQGPDQMTRVRVASDLPAAERPTAAVLNTNSATFQTLAQQARQARGADFSVCDIELPVRVTPAA
ncbi:peptidylprolyl isomerase [Brevundimonas nasdae]|uniref:Peptidylprolyl isomerase n=1 Tax=Brevundimonas nasdae TaxID=172043 RepID=A0ACD4VPG1_9CAUL|nr:peptidylprolyl isomerase [Brevundimonas nasdae]WOB79852.1 peptidylprolyl isomerase [Brevundimonas nasdae]